MYWREMAEADKELAARLIGTIDAGERWVFEHPERNPDFERAVCARMCGAQGALFGCVYAGKLRFTIAFEDDLPEGAEEETEQLLGALVAKEPLDAVIWCRNENARLRRAIEAMFQVKPNYESREMSVSKAEFADWKPPRLPKPMRIEGYDPNLLGDYLQLLERAMAHLIPPGTTPYLDARDYYEREFAKIAPENRFHALWADGALAGVCFSWGGEVSTLALDAAHRRRGAGYALLHAGIAGAFGNRDGDLCLYVVDQNPDALGFYRHVSMRETGHCARYLVKRPVA